MIPQWLWHPLGFEYPVPAMPFFVRNPEKCHHKSKHSSDDCDETDIGSNEFSLPTGAIRANVHRHKLFTISHPHETTEHQSAHPSIVAAYLEYMWANRGHEWYTDGPSSSSKWPAGGFHPIFFHPRTLQHMRWPWCTSTVWKLAVVMIVGIQCFTRLTKSQRGLVGEERASATREIICCRKG